MENRMVCECYGIRVDDIKAAIQNGDDSFEKLESRLCVPFLFYFSGVSIGRV